MAHGSFVWNELLTYDVEASKAFYAATIGWSFESMEMPGGGTYWVARLDGKGVAGIMHMPATVPAGVPPHWFEYLEVDDVDARVKLFEQNGGKAMRPAFDVPGVGRLAILTDNTGAAIGLMTAAPPA
jgi:predicted enzyme related to lactoylglutathione lyase